MEYDNLLIFGQTDSTSLVTNAEPVSLSGINYDFRLRVRDFDLARRESALFCGECVWYLQVTRS